MMSAVDHLRCFQNGNEQQQNDFVEDGTAKKRSGTVNFKANHGAEYLQQAHTSNNRNGSKPIPGCRQILFNLMKRRLSSEPVVGGNEDSGSNNEDNNGQVDSLFVHQEPCIFCRILAARAASETFGGILHGSNKIQNYNANGNILLPTLGQAAGQNSGINETKIQTTLSLLSTNDTMIRKILIPFLLPSERTVLFNVPEFCDTFCLENYFCPKHGHEYVPDDQIVNSAAFRKKKGKKSNKNGKKKKEYMMFADILEQIVRDGKDPTVFRNKLAFRIEAFPAQMAENESINLAEKSFSKDPDYGRYFRRMKKCIACEKLAECRDRAKQGMVKCRFCNSYYDCKEDRKCGKKNCERVLPCPACRGREGKKRAFQCGKCSVEFCTDMHNIHSCARCVKSVCEGCQETMKLKFHQCSLCRNIYCSECDLTFFCKMCNKSFCRLCRGGGTLKGEGGNIVCCNECVPQQICYICRKRKSFEHYEEESKMWCSICGICSCIECAKMFSCHVCEETFCLGCDKPSAQNCKKCRDVVCCLGCGGTNTCGSCGEKSCRTCSKYNQSCSLCDQFVCEKCGVMHSCIRCGVAVCAECIPEATKSCADCDVCVCDWCSELEFKFAVKECQRCGDCYCVNCRGTDQCDTCLQHVCSNCTETCEISHLSNCKTCLRKLEDFYGQFF
mmetsp:Transcript_27393/g.74883  ORF Transcript_27393/g.74883 Transcript_27393/m.74883 type:complete len:671 (-) Transcript_27393:2568-4580(-)